MPFNKSYKRALVVRRPQSGKQVMQNKKMYKIAKKVTKRIINQQIERHYFDTEQDNTVSSSGSIYELSGTTVGDGDTQRTGDRITIKSLQIRGNVNLGDATNIVRIIVFQWLADSGAALPDASTDILQSTTVGTANAPFGMYSKDFAGYTWVPLYDKTIQLTTQDDAKLFYVNISAKNFKGKARPYIQYQGSGQNGVGNLFMAVYSDSGAITHPGINFVARLRFTN